MTASRPSIRCCEPKDIDTLCCSDGEYPGAVRALAFDGAEVVYRPSEAVPMTTADSDAGGTWLLQNRTHAYLDGLDMVCPEAGPVRSCPAAGHPVDIAGGNGHVVAHCAHDRGRKEAR